MRCTGRAGLAVRPADRSVNMRLHRVPKIGRLMWASDVRPSSRVLQRGSATDREALAPAEGRSHRPKTLTPGRGRQLAGPSNRSPVPEHRNQLLGHILLQRVLKGGYTSLHQQVSQTQNTCARGCNEHARGARRAGARRSQLEARLAAESFHPHTAHRRAKISPIRSRGVDGMLAPVASPSCLSYKTSACLLYTSPSPRD